MKQPVMNHTDTTDEREGLPSSSGLHRIIECAACLPFTNYLRDNDLLPPDHASEDAEHGTEVHRICAQFATGEEPTGERDDIEEARELFETAEQEIIKTFGKPLAELKLIVEERFWHTDLKGNRIASGRFDLIAMDRETGGAVLIDYKTGHDEVPHPAENWQLKHGAVLLALTHEALEVTGCIIQTGRRPAKHTWTPDEIADMDEEIVAYLGACHVGHYLERGFNPAPERCHYCPARLHCPRLLADVVDMVAVAKAMPDASQMVACAATPVLSDFLIKCGTVRLLETAAKAEMTARLERGETDENYHLEASAPKRVITDARVVVNGLIAAGVTVDEALGAMKINVGSAEGLLKEATGLKGKQLKDEFAQLAGAALTMSEPTPTLKRK